MAFWNNKEDEEQFVQSDELSQQTQGIIAPPLATAQKPAVWEGEKGLKSTQPPPPVEPEGDQTANSLERYGKVRSALGPGTVIQGKLSFDTPVRIDGKLSGEIYSSKALIVGASGMINAQVQVASLIVMGEVKGSIRASERVEILAGGRLDGDIATPCVVVVEGGFFNGACSMKGVDKTLAAPPVFDAFPEETKKSQPERKPEGKPVQQPMGTKDPAKEPAKEVAKEARLQ